jgi:hypothetical protein
VKLEIVKDQRPLPDIGICSKCSLRHKLSNCETEWDSDGWEDPTPYEVYLCPKCEDGGCIDDFEYSTKQGKAYDRWEKRNKESK